MITLTSAVVCLAATIYHEARGLPTQVQSEIAKVVLNRTETRDMNVCSVIKEPRQFPWAKRNQFIPLEEDKWNESMITAKKLLKSYKPNDKGYVYFVSFGTPTWKVCSPKRMEKMTFYKECQPILQANKPSKQKVA